MIGLGAPAWLTGLLLIPLVRELHRRQGPARRVQVPALFLWRGARSPAATGRRGGPPDPAWRRRALLLALLVVALARPAWQGPPAGTTPTRPADGRDAPPPRAPVIRSLSARPSLAAPERLTIAVAVANPGAEPASPTLVLRLGDSELLRRPVAVAGGGTWTGRIETARPSASGTAARLTAALTMAEGGDGGTLALDTAPLRRLSVRVGDTCGEPVRIALRTTGRIDVAPLPAAADLAIKCSERPPPTAEAAIPRLWLAAGGGTRSTTPALWTLPPEQSPAFAIDAGWRAADVRAAMAGGRVLLAGGDRPLIIEHDRPARILVLLDTSDPALAAGTALPLLLDWLVSRLTGTLAADGMTAADPPMTADVPNPESPVRPAPPERLDLTAPVLLAALLLSLFEAAAGGRWRTL